jgi:hypothetical protein
MTRGPLPRFSAREGLSKISASAMNRLVEVLENAERRLVEVERRTLNAGGFERSVPRDKTVVIVKVPADGDKFLTVREAGYATIPPKACTGDEPNVVCYYAWYGVDFEVYPPLGKEAIDYDGDEWDGATDPKLDTVFHRCHRENEVWVLDHRAEGAGSVIPIVLVVRSGASGTSSLPTTWSYDVYEFKMTATGFVFAGDLIMSNISPVTAPHLWRRPPVGRLLTATRGYAHFDTGHRLVIGWINEVYDQQRCS